MSTEKCSANTAIRGCIESDSAGAGFLMAADLFSTMHILAPLNGKWKMGTAPYFSMKKIGSCPHFP
jgi:hypothetical protein